MKRRKFIKDLSVFGAGAFMLENVPFKVWAETSNPLQRLALECNNDRVLIILQMLGGNDGVNTAVPLAQYAEYQNARPNIALPNTDKDPRRLINLDSTLADSQLVGLHPDMGGFKSLYDEGKLKLVQGVSYAFNNGSHFRSRDIFYMGGGAFDYPTSGWAGRYLSDSIAPLHYPKDFPNSNMLDPLALEFGNEQSLLFHQDEDITSAISIYDPPSFFNLVENLEGFDDKAGVDPRGIPPAALADSPYYNELNYILSLEQKTDEYDDRLLATYNAGKQNDPNVTYPTEYPFRAPNLKNPIARELKIIANLIHGGCKTKIYLVKIGGFDTHAQQVDKADRTMGSHAALLYHISATMKSFQDDLKARGIEDRVLTMTTSEFGRRVYSNGSAGTDHGNGAPMFIIGKGVSPGVYGNGPDMMKDNVDLQHDYRQVYASILKQWFCVDAGKVDNTDGLIFKGDYNGRGEDLNIIASPNEVSDFLLQRFKMNSCYPNPAKDSTVISFYLNTPSMVELYLKNSEGATISTVLNEYRNYGENSVFVDLRNVRPGIYFYQIKAGRLQDTKKLVVM